MLPLKGRTLPFALCSLHHRCLEKKNILEGAVGSVGADALYGFDNVKADSDFSKHRVLSVEPGRAALFAVGLSHFLGHFAAAFGGFIDAFRDVGEVGLAVALSPYDVELRTAAAALRIDVVAFACGSQGTAVVIVAGEVELQGKRIVRTAIAIHLIGDGVARVWVARLYHEVFDDAVENDSVVIAFAHEFEEIVAVGWGGVEERHRDVANGSVEQHRRLFLAPGGEGQEGGEKEQA